MIKNNVKENLFDDEEKYGVLSGLGPALLCSVSV